MFATVAVVLYTHNLALGVLTGVLLSALSFAKKVALYQNIEVINENNTQTYIVHGQVFFASANKFMAVFRDFSDSPKAVIDLTHAHFWDLSAVTALDRVVHKFEKNKISVEVIGYNEASRTIISKLSENDKNKDIFGLDTL